MSNELDDWLNGFRDLNPDVEQEEAKREKKKSTLTLQMELPAMDYRNFDFYEDLSDEHKKEISLWLLMRFMSSSQNNTEHHIIMVNELVNHNFSALNKHPGLQWKLLALCGTNKKQYHPWIAPPKGLKKNKLEQAILDLNPTLKDSDLEMLLEINKGKKVWEKYFIDNGFDDKTIKEILKDVKDE